MPTPTETLRFKPLEYMLFCHGLHSPLRPIRQSISIFEQFGRKLYIDNQPTDEWQAGKYLSQGKILNRKSPDCINEMYPKIRIVTQYGEVRLADAIEAAKNNPDFNQFERVLNGIAFRNRAKAATCLAKPSSARYSYEGIPEPIEITYDQGFLKSIHQIVRMQPVPGIDRQLLRRLNGPESLIANILEIPPQKPVADAEQAATRKQWQNIRWVITGRREEKEEEVGRIISAINIGIISTFHFEVPKRVTELRRAPQLLSAAEAWISEIDEGKGILSIEQVPAAFLHRLSLTVWPYNIPLPGKEIDITPLAAQPTLVPTLDYLMLCALANFQAVVEQSQ